MNDCIAVVDSNSLDCRIFDQDGKLVASGAYRWGGHSSVSVGRCLLGFAGMAQLCDQAK